MWPLWREVPAWALGAATAKGTCPSTGHLRAAARPHVSAPFGSKDPRPQKGGPGTVLLPGPGAALQVDAEGQPAPRMLCTPAQAPRMLHPNPELPGPPPYAGPPPGSLGDEAGSPAFRNCPSSPRGLSPRRHQGLAMVRDLPLPPTGQGQGTTATSSPGGSMGPPGRVRALQGPLARTPRWGPQPLHGAGPGGGL